VSKRLCRNVTDFERENSNLINVGEYKSLLGALLYIAVKSRSDISFAVNQTSRNCENPTEADYGSLMHILQYLKGTINKNQYVIIKETNSLDILIQILQMMKKIH